MTREMVEKKCRECGDNICDTCLFPESQFCKDCKIDICVECGKQEAQ